MTTNVFSLRQIAVAIIAIGAISFSSLAASDEVKSLRGKPSSNQILEALSPPAGTGGNGTFRTRGLSLSGGAKQADSQPAAQPTAAPEPRALDLDIKFEFNSGALSDDGREVLDQLAEALKSDALSGSKSIVLEGHADAKGNPAYNKLLSTKRAQSAKDYLVSKHGISKAKLKSVGKGSTEPVDPNNPEDEVNRRVRVIVNG